MANCGYGNFGFMYDIDAFIYDKLKGAESDARLRSEPSRFNSIRQALERFANNVIRDNSLGEYVPSFTNGASLNNTTLWAKLKTLSNVRELQRAGYLGVGESMKDKAPLPFSHPVFDKITYQLEKPLDGSDINTEKNYDFLRLLGNACSHDDYGEPQEKAPRVCYENIKKGLRLFHKILKTYYKADTPDFEEKRMTVGDYIVDDMYIPNDTVYSKCSWELMAHTVDRYGNRETTVLIRIYEQNGPEDALLHRNDDCFMRAKKSSPFGIATNNMAEVSVLSDEKSEFLVIAYTFCCDIELLGNKTVKGLDVKTKLSLCLELAECLQWLHKAGVYHRLLNHECIYIGHHEEQLRAFIVKFDFAKIEMGSAGTVIVRANEIKSMYKSLEFEKYIASEWEGKECDSTDVNWSAVDVYSLGVLMLCILTERFDNKILPDIDELLDAGVGDGIIELISQMLEDTVSERCGIAYVCRKLREETALWS